MPTLERNQERIRVYIFVRSHMTCSSIWVPFLRPPDVGNKRIVQGVSNGNNGSKITGKDLKLLRPWPWSHLFPQARLIFFTTFMIVATKITLFFSYPK